ncbi:MAG TPA: hypothetical protein VKJ45_18630 [Blastocatellia bacterium]|nr:hypothetical protein [Blastocatellia bacterium]
MGRIVKVILVHIAITMLIALVLPSSQSPRPHASPIDLSSTVWDYQGSLIRPTYPPQDLQGRYLLPPPRDQRTSGQDKVGGELKKLVQSARDGGPQYR